MTTDKSSKQEQLPSNRCAALTSKNKDCKNPAVKGSEYCGQHDNWHLKTDAEKAPSHGGPRAPTKAEAQKMQDEAGAKTPAGGAVITESEAEQAVARAADPAFAKYELAKRVAHTLACSSLVPDPYRGKPNDVFVAINMGSELGMEPFQAIQSIAVIDGKPCLYGDGLIGVVRASPICMWIEESLSEDGLTATCKTQRKGDPNPITASYSMTDAMQAGIDSKFNWKKHPKRMLQMRARAYCLRDAYPDLLKGLGVVEERQDHEDTPPPVISYELPEATSNKPLLQSEIDSVKNVFGEGVEVAPTLSEVERAIHQSDTMEELLKAGDMAKGLNTMDQGTARITYKKMRAVLLEPKK